ncbi:MAG: hypothetical protein ACR2QF_14995, partial [Geminicoccaceae bacterium]
MRKILFAIITLAFAAFVGANFAHTQWAPHGAAAEDARMDSVETRLSLVETGRDDELEKIKSDLGYLKTEIKALTEENIKLGEDADEQIDIITDLKI